MSMYHVYLFEETIVIPQVVVTEAGFYIDDLPIDVIPVKDIIKWQKLFYKMFIQENKSIRTPDSESETGSLILEKLNIDKWSDFEAKATMYTIHFSPGYTTIYSTITSEDKTWQVGQNIRKFASFAPISTIIQALTTEILMLHTTFKSSRNLLKLNS